MGFKSFIGKVWGGIKKAGKWIIDKGKKIIKPISKIISPISRVVAPMLPGKYKPIAEIIGGFGDTIGGMFGGEQAPNDDAQKKLDDSAKKIIEDYQDLRRGGIPRDPREFIERAKGIYRDGRDLWNAGREYMGYTGPANDTGPHILSQQHSSLEQMPKVRLPPRTNRGWGNVIPRDKPKYQFFENQNSGPRAAVGRPEMQGARYAVIRPEQRQLPMIRPAVIRPDSQNM